MSYGIIVESKGNGGMKAGVNNCKVTSAKLTTINSEKYKGSAVDIMFTFESGGERNMRLFPLNKSAIAADIEKRPHAYTDAKTGKVKNVEEVFNAQTSEFTLFVKHFVTGFVTESVWDTSLLNWLHSGAPQTFESFMGFAISLLPANYTMIPTKVLAGYTKNSEYYDVPTASKAWMFKDMVWFSTDLNPRELSAGNKYFELTRVAAPSNQDATNDAVDF